MIDGYNTQLFNIFSIKMHFIMSITLFNNASKYILIRLIFNDHEVLCFDDNAAKKLILIHPFFSVRLN